MAIEGMNHFTILTEDLEASRRFYIGVLGLTEGYRPPLTFPGAWLYCGKQAVLHIIAGRPVPKPPAGVIDHMAFTGVNLAATTAQLKAHNIPYELRKQADSGTWQLFCYDPNGARVELDFEPHEQA